MKLLLLLLLPITAIADIYNGSYESWSNVTGLPSGYFKSVSKNTNFKVNSYLYMKCAGYKGGSCRRVTAAKLTLSNTGFGMLHLNPNKFQSVIPGQWRTYKDKTRCNTTWPVIVKYYDVNKRFMYHENLGNISTPNSTWMDTRFNHFIPAGVAYIHIGRAAITPGTCIQDNVHDVKS